MKREDLFVIFAMIFAIVVLFLIFGIIIMADTSKSEQCKKICSDKNLKYAGMAEWDYYCIGVDKDNKKVLIKRE